MRRYRYQATLADGKLVVTYKAGHSKLLASTNVTADAHTNDNYVYFAMSRYMEKPFGTYPMYPSKWDETLTSDQNLEAETYESGYSSSFSLALDVDDTTMSGETVSNGPPYDISDYLDWYQPKVLNRTAVFEAALNWRPYFSEPHTNDVVCQTSDHSSLYDDCV
jgi:hypothetical protein